MERETDIHRLTFSKCFSFRRRICLATKNFTRKLSRIAISTNSNAPKVHRITLRRKAQIHIYIYLAYVKSWLWKTLLQREMHHSPILFLSPFYVIIFSHTSMGPCTERKERMQRRIGKGEWLRLARHSWLTGKKRPPS